MGRSEPEAGARGGPAATASDRSWLGRTASLVALELRSHAPFTLLGTLSGVAVMAALLLLRVPQAASETLFWSFHPMHVLLSALATAGMYRRHRRGGWASFLLTSYVGSVGVATLSDCLIPYVGELLLGLPNRGVHLGFIEKWWLVNPLALLGIGAAVVRPATKFPHAGHVWLSTWASLFHMTMALGGEVGWAVWATIPLFLFLAVWLPCCTSDIVFPILVGARDGCSHSAGSSQHGHAAIHNSAD